MPRAVAVLRLGSDFGTRSNHGGRARARCYWDASLHCRGAMACSAAPPPKGAGEGRKADQSAVQARLGNSAEQARRPVMGRDRPRGAVG